MRVTERIIDRTELYSADEIIVCGTGAGIAWIRSVDHRTVGDGLAGPVATAAMRVYDDIIRGRNRTYGVELLPVYGIRPGDACLGDAPVLEQRRSAEAAGAAHRDASEHLDVVPAAG